MKTSPPSLTRFGFTLIESLAVVLILSMIIALATPTMLDVVRASRLTSAGDLLTGKMIEAQGLALTFSSDVELRIYKTPNTQPMDGGSGQFLQLLQWTENEADSAEDDNIASLKKIGPQISLPEGVAISEDPVFSSLWNIETQTEASPTDNLEYVAIRFRPDGSTDLGENTPWHLTLVELHQAKSTQLPPNFYTVQIDPVSSKLETFRPE